MRAAFERGLDCSYLYDDNPVLRRAEWCAYMLGVAWEFETGNRAVREHIARNLDRLCHRFRFEEYAHAEPG